MSDADEAAWRNCLVLVRMNEATASEGIIIAVTTVAVKLIALRRSGTMTKTKMSISFDCIRRRETKKRLYFLIVHSLLP